MLWWQSFSTFHWPTSDACKGCQYLPCTWMGRKHCGFLCILALIPVANQSSQEWKRRAVLSLLVWLPNDMKHTDAISQGFKSVDSRSASEGSEKDKFKQYRSTYMMHVMFLIGDYPLWKTYVNPQIKEGNWKSQHQTHQAHRIIVTSICLFVHKQLDLFQSSQRGGLVLHP